MELKLNLQSATPADIACAVAMLNALSAHLSASTTAESVQPTVTNNGGSLEPAANLPAGDPAGTAAPDVAPAAPEAAEVVKPKREKKAKTIQAEEGIAAHAAILDIEKLAPATDLSLEALRAAIQRLASANGMAAGREALAKFGCVRVTELMDKPDADKLAFLALCPEAA